MSIPKVLRERDWAYVHVNYISPDGRKFNNIRTLAAFLELNNICDVSVENFSFTKKPLYNGPPGETVRKVLSNQNAAPAKRVGKSKIHLPS